MQTEKLYENDGMLMECTATVLAYEEKDGRHFITLDQSVFAPEGGGQKADTGWLTIAGKDQITAARLLDAQDQVKGLSLCGPVYELSDKIPAGISVLCKLDEEKRLMRMQQHSGEHILSGLVHKHFGYDHISFHVRDTEPVIVCFNGTFTDEEINRMEVLANEVIRLNLPIRVSYPSKEELASITYRSKIEIEGQVRLVEIPGVDVCACCAPHLPSTGRIGLLKIISTQSYKGGTQLNILCGERALQLVMAEHQKITELARIYSTSTDGLTQAILTQQKELHAATEALTKITEEKLLQRIEALTDTDAPCLFEPSMSPHAMKICYNALTEKFDRYCAVFNGDDEKGYQFYAGHPKKNSSDLHGLMREKLDAKGGGSKEMIQGKVQKKKEELLLFFQNLS